MQSRVRFNVLFGSLRGGNKQTKQMEKTPSVGFSCAWNLQKGEENREYSSLLQMVFPLLYVKEHQPPKHHFCLSPSHLCLGRVNEKWISRVNKFYESLEAEGAASAHKTSKGD